MVYGSPTREKTPMTARSTFSVDIHAWRVVPVSAKGIPEEKPRSRTKKIRRFAKASDSAGMGCILSSDAGRIPVYKTGKDYYHFKMKNSRGIICAVGGGKGGVGKSLVSVNLACALAREGHEVILIDADLAGANVHTMFGVKSPFLTLNEFVNKTVGTIEGLLIPTEIKTLRLICGATDFIDLANPGYNRKQKIVRSISELSADFIVVDVGAGSTFNNLDFFNMADVGVLVTTPEPTAILGCYEFLKMAIRRKILTAFSEFPSTKEMLSTLLGGNEAKKARKVGEAVKILKEIDEKAAEKVCSLVRETNVCLAVNTAPELEGEKVHRAFTGISQQYLQVNIPFLGSIPRSATIEKSVRSMVPVLLSGSEEETAPFVKMAVKLVSVVEPLLSAASSSPEKSDPRNTRGSASNSLLVCFNEVVVRAGKTLRIQTEDLGPEKALVQTLVFLSGRVVFVKENSYAVLGVEGASREAVREKVHWQHRGILAGIRGGKIDREITEAG